MNQFCKGQLVIVKAYAHFKYVPSGGPQLKAKAISAWGELVHKPPLRKHKTVKALFRYRVERFEAILIGKSRRATGCYSQAGWLDESPSLVVDKWHDVWLAVPLGNSIDYLKPFTVLESDIEIQTRRHARGSYLMRRKWLDVMERRV